MDSVETLGGPVIGGKEHQGVLVDFELLEQGCNLSHLPVHHGIHGGRYLGVSTLPWLVLVDSPGGFVLWDLVRGMRRSPRAIEKERLVLVVFDEFDGFVVDCMVSVTPVQFDLLAVAEKMGVVGVCMPLVVVAVVEVEPLSLRGAVLSLVAQTPLAETTCSIPRLFEYLRHRYVLGE